jgi:hypothetical protein
MPDKNDSNFISAGSGAGSSGPFLAKVVSHLDPTYMGGLEVEILRPTGNSSSEGQVHQVKYMSPFYGVTGATHTSKNNDYNGTQKSYGMWMIPPDPGTTVVIFFIDGDPKRGYWFGCVQDENMNFMVPGIAATQQVVDGSDRAPVAEYNKNANESVSDATAVKKPKHPFAEVLTTQGLLKDDTRGITTSSARRETPSMVFGISTPGPADKQSGATRGSIGKKEHEIKNAFVSRLGGSTFVMDDGDDRFLRKSKAKEGPPEYIAVEQGGTGGSETIPHNELIRLRTRTGHQILLHNSEDLIYIGNANGTAWIELSSNGKIDIYAKDSISLHTENDFNLTADRDINLTAKNNINMHSGAVINQYATTNLNIKADGTGKLNISGTMDIKSGSAFTVDGEGAKAQHASGNIDLNGGSISQHESINSIEVPKANRIPMAEPWAGHENLDPTMFTPDKTEASLEPTEPAPEKYNQYTTVTDTFNKVKGAE